MTKECDRRRITTKMFDVDLNPEIKTALERMSWEFIGFKIYHSKAAMMSESP
jgi:hypothetical protein